MPVLIYGLASRDCFLGYDQCLHALFCSCCSRLLKCAHTTKLPGGLHGIIAELVSSTSVPKFHGPEGSTDGVAN